MIAVDPIPKRFNDSFQVFFFNAISKAVIRGNAVDIPSEMPHDVLHWGTQNLRCIRQFSMYTIILLAR